MISPSILPRKIAPLFFWVILLTLSANSFGSAAPTPSPSATATPATAIVWGHCKANTISSNTTPPTIQRELQDMWDDGGRCPRIDADAAKWGWLDTAMKTARSIGFTKFVLIYYGNLTYTTLPDETSFADGAVALARAYPDAFIELSNEPNLHAVSAQQYATLAKAAYRAIKDAGLPNIVLLGSVGNSNSVIGNYSMLDWCKQLVANGCIPGQAFDWANYHNYGNPINNENWWHIYTPATTTVAGRTSAGESCQTVFGNPPFVMTEFGASLSKDCGGNEAVQAQYINEWMAQFKAQPLFRLGCQYALADEAPGVGTGYGLRRLDLSHRPSWDTYKQNAGAPSPSPNPTPYPPSNLSIK